MTASGLQSQSTSFSTPEIQTCLRDRKKKRKKKKERKPNNTIRSSGSFPPSTPPKKRVSPRGGEGAARL